jgi:hypothetical protein
MFHVDRCQETLLPQIAAALPALAQLLSLGFRWIFLDPMDL